MRINLQDGCFIRPANAADHSALRQICLQTGDAGRDATTNHDDPALLGNFYAVPYQVLEPELAFVIDGPDGVCGYVLGALDSPQFYARMVNEWLTPLRQTLPDPGPDQSQWSGSDWLRRKIHHDPLAVSPSLAPYPSHLHIDLLPSAQGRGWGGALMRHLFSALIAKGSSGVHLGVDPKNEAAQAFYRKLGFARLQASDIPADAVVMARPLP